VLAQTLVACLGVAPCFPAETKHISIPYSTMEKSRDEVPVALVAHITQHSKYRYILLHTVQHITVQYSALQCAPAAC